jgi:hypothetical protein
MGTKIHFLNYVNSKYLLKISGKKWLGGVYSDTQKAVN